MVREQEQEQEQQKEVEKEAEVQTGRERDHETPWSLSVLSTENQSLKCVTANGRFYPFSQFSTPPWDRPLAAAPPAALISDNFASQVWRSAHVARRIKSSNVMMRLSMRNGESCMVAISLAEAEGLRRSLHSGGNGYLPAGLCLPNGKSMDTSTLNEELGCERAVLRMLDGELHFSRNDVVALLGALAAEKPKLRQAAFGAILQCHRRSSHTWKGTSVAPVLTETDVAHFKHMMQVATTLRQVWGAGGDSVHAMFNKLDVDQNGLLSIGELVRMNCTCQGRARGCIMV